jgi:ribonuclease R
MTKKGRSNPQDPYAAREATKYAKPIPSREFILETLSEAGTPLPWQRIAELLNLDEPDDLEALTRRLKAMERDGQLVRNRRNAYGLLDKMDLVRGRVVAHPDGFGFLIPDDGSDDLFLSARQMRTLIHGDRVVAHVAGIDRRGRREGAIVDVLERNTHQVVGRFLFEGGMPFVAPDNKRITHDIFIPPENQNGAQPGQIVLAELVEQPTKRRQPVGRIIEVLGDHMAPGMEIDIAIRAYGLPHVWPEVVEDEIGSLKPHVLPAAKKGREDIRHLPLVTIDGADARDFDDAVFCEPHGESGRDWRLLVAIADVSHYVQWGSGLDEEARERSTSVYFPGRVIPMLPEVLSNGLCSINPKVDRLCMVCEMIVSSGGKVKSHRFFEGLMRSHARLIYDDVAALLEGDADLRQQHEELVPHLENLYALYSAFARRRTRRGAIEFETTETRIVFGEGKKIERIEPTVRNDAHRLIEECMIAANVAAAKYLAKHKMPTLYRVHDVPKEEKLADLREFLAELGLHLAGGDDPQAGDYAKLLREVQGRPDAHLIQTVMLRSMNQAVYSPENVGHFGLALEAYAHFTSPIRRYPDLLVHRAIRHVLRGGTPQDFTYGFAEMETLGEHCSTNERRADEATRDATDWLKCEYMMDKVGETFDGIITGVTSFGFFAELDDIYVEGLVHITSLKNEYYHFDPAHHRLMGERTHKVYRLGDKVRVRVVRVDLDEKKIDFELADGAAEEGPSEGADQRSKGRRKKGGSGEQKASQQGKKSKKAKGRKRGGRSRKSTGAKSEQQQSDSSKPKSRGRRRR